jgi:hypothetical protein
VYTVLKMETVGFSETVISTYEYTRHRYSEEHHHHLHRENLRSHESVFVVFVDILTLAVSEILLPGLNKTNRGL